MQGIVIYQSKYGATKKYAEWIAEETGFDTIETSKAKVSDLQKYDVVLLGGGVYATGIAGISFLRKNMKALQGKKIIVFCDGASPFEAQAFEAIKKQNMKDDLQAIPFFYCRGGWDMEAMGFMDKHLCQMLRKAVAKKNPDDYEAWEKALMAAGDEKCDWTDKKYLQPIFAEINRSLSPESHQS